MIRCTVLYLVDHYSLFLQTWVLLTIPLLTSKQWVGRTVHHQSPAELWMTFSLPSAAFNNGWQKSSLTSVLWVTRLVSSTTDSMIFNTNSSYWHHVSSQSRQELLLPPVSLDPLQDPGHYPVLVVAPQPLGPVTQALWTEAGIQDANSTTTPVQIMKMHEVPCCYGFLASNATQAWLLGSKNAYPV